MMKLLFGSLAFLAVEFFTPVLGGAMDMFFLSHTANLTGDLIASTGARTKVGSEMYSCFLISCVGVIPNVFFHHPGEI